MTYTTVISACGKCGQWQEALTLLEEMHRGRLESNAVSHNAAISACQKAKETAKALQSFQKMRQRFLGPDTITYSSAISACEQDVDWQQALHLLGEADLSGLATNANMFSMSMQ